MSDKIQLRLEQAERELFELMHTPNADPDLIMFLKSTINSALAILEKKGGKQ